MKYIDIDTILRMNKTKYFNGKTDINKTAPRTNHQ